MWGLPMSEEIKPKSTRGFASMSPERVREIAKLGGQAVPKEKRSFSVNRALAQDAGRKGGRATAPEKRAYARDRDLATESGRKGGLLVHEKSRS